jgi:hypothetical protein
MPSLMVMTSCTAYNQLTLDVLLDNSVLQPDTAQLDRQLGRVRFVEQVSMLSAEIMTAS